MLTNLQATQTQTALSPRVEWYCRQVERYLTYRLREHLGKRNQNGTRYTPFQRGCVLTMGRDSKPVALFVVFDAERLWHFQPDRLMETRFVQSVSGALRRPVGAFEHTQGVDDPIPTGIAFCVLLRNDLAPVAQLASPIPREAKLDLAALNGSHKNKLLVPIGVGRDGPVWKHVNTVQHVLYVGTTGCGKTSAMQSMLAALLTQNDPDLVKVALIDTARSEFVFWHNAPHVFERVAYSAGDAFALLKQVESEVERRGELLGAAMRRSIQAFNTDAPRGKRLPYLLVVVDECLDLVQSGRGGNAVNDLIKHVATVGRKAGVFLHAGTQYPSAAEGLSRIIATNLRTFAFRMDAVGARTVGCPSASAISEKTPGRMFARFDDQHTELQAFYLDDAELERVARQAGFVANTKTNAEQGAPKRDEVAELVRWAVESNGGVLTQSNIVEMLSQWRGAASTDREARRIAETLVTKGMLAKDPRHQNRRTVTDLARKTYCGLTAVSVSNAPTTASNGGGAGGSEYPALLLDVDDAALLEKIQPRLDALMAEQGLSAQAAYEQIIVEEQR